MTLISNVVKRAQNLSVMDISTYKVAVLSASALFALIVPGVMGAPLWVYIVIAAVLAVVAFGTIIKKEGNYIKAILQGNFSKKYFKKYKIVDFAVFELTMFAIGLLVIKIFPVVLTINLAWYVGAFALSGGYLMGKMFPNKK